MTFMKVVIKVNKFDCFFLDDGVKNLYNVNMYVYFFSPNFFGKVISYYIRWIID